MLGNDEEIMVPPAWRITAARLKLALKYGIADEGPWKPIASNLSVTFDAYTLRRGPMSGLPNLADLAVTQLMNSRVNSRDVQRLALWLSLDANRARLTAVRDAIKSFEGLHDADDDAVREVGTLVDQMMVEQDDNGRRTLHGIGPAKVFKWLSAWAPAHIPMIDRYVAGALIDMEPGLRSPGAGELLSRFQKLLRKRALPAFLPVWEIGSNDV